VPKGTNMIEAARRGRGGRAALLLPPQALRGRQLPDVPGRDGHAGRGSGDKGAVIDPATGKQRINWSPRPTIACATNASPGLHIRTTSPMVKDCREGVMEFLLINHPLDCPICDQAGECKLQEQATGYGRGYSRYIEQKNVKPKRTLLGPRVMLDDERCILCSRCIRFCKEVAKDDVLGFTTGAASHPHVLPGPKAREQLLAQHRGHLPGGRPHEHGFPVQDARLVPQADEQHRHRVERRARTRSSGRARGRSTGSRRARTTP
jgi:NADH-quinone oxidoreductase subunit G